MSAERSEPVFIGNPSDAELDRSAARRRSGDRKRRDLAAARSLVTGARHAACSSALIVYTFYDGIGVWGINIPVAWAFAITNFVWWIGIGHAGTFICAILLLFEQKWRTSINRFAEAMTLFAVMQAGLFPLLHLGRPWFAYWLAPYPATMQRLAELQERAAVGRGRGRDLLHRVAALLVPGPRPRSRAGARSRADASWQRYVYGIFALGWRGSARHQRHYRMAYGLLGGLATPLVLSVHSVVSSDFAITILPGWHSTIFPPYFVAGAIFSGFCMVATLMIPIRRVYGLQNVITNKHLDNVCKMILLTGLIVDYSYLCEWYLAWYSGEQLRDVDDAARARQRAERLGVLVHDVLQRRARAGVVVQARAHAASSSSGSSRSSSTSACGPSASASSRCRCSRIFCRRRGRAFHPSPVDWGLRSAPAASSRSCSSCSCASCRSFRRRAQGAASPSSSRDGRSATSECASGLAAEFASANDLLIAVQRLWRARLSRARRVHAASGRGPRRGALSRPLAHQLGRVPARRWAAPSSRSALQWYCNAWSYALNVGGRPPFGWITRHSDHLRDRRAGRVADARSSRSSGPSGCRG